MKPTRKQLDLLKVLNPYSGRIVSCEEAAYALNISVSAVWHRMAGFKKRCPEAHAKFIKLRQDMGNGQKAVSKPLLVGRFEQFDETKIREIF